MESVDTEALLSAALYRASGGSSGQRIDLSTVVDRVSGSGQRLSRQVEIAVSVETLVERGLVGRETTEDGEWLWLTDEGRARASEVIDGVTGRVIEVVDGDGRRELTVGEAAAELDRSPVGLLVDCSENGVYYDQRRVEEEALVGREEERAAFEAVLDGVERTGDGEVVRLVGPGGNGKTALGDALLAATPDAVDAVRTTSRAAETEPYQPVRDLLAGLGADDPFEATAFEAEDLETFEAQQTGLFTEITDRLTPDTGTRMLFFDDVNHADPATWAYLAFLSEQLSDRPLVVVLSHRPGTLPEDAPVHPARDLARTCIEVTGLDREATGELVEQVLGHRGVPEAFVDAVHDRTGGVPLFVETTVETLRETSQVDPQLQVYPTDLAEFDLPAEVTETIQQQVTFLEPAVREVLEWVAVASGFVPVPVLQRAADYDPERVETTLDTAAQMGLLSRETRAGEAHVTFRNEVFGDALAERLSESERERRHETLAGLFEQRVSERDSIDDQRTADLAATVAYHHERSNDLGSAIEWYREAADRATDVYAHETAIDYYYRVIELARRADETGTVLSANEQLAGIYVVTGEYEQASRHVQFVRERTAEDGSNRSQRLGRLRARIHTDQGEFEAAIEAASAALDGEPSVEECRLLGVLAEAHEGQSDYQQMREAAQRQRDLAEALGDPSLEAEAIDRLGQAARHLGEYDRARECHEKSLAINEETGNREGKADSLHGLATTAVRLDEFEQVEEYFRKALAIRREIGDRRSQAKTLNNLGVIAQKRGDHDQARTYYEKSLAIEREIGNRRGASDTLSNLGLLAQSRGNCGRAREYYEESLAIDRETGDRRGESLNLTNLGQVAQLGGEYDRTREYLEEGLAIQREIGDRWGESHSLNHLGDLTRRRGETDQAAAYYEDALEGARELDIPHLEALSLSGLCALARQAGDDQRASEHYEEARDLSEEAGEPSDIAGIRLEGARVALARGDIGTARQRAEAAREAFADIGDSFGLARSRRVLGEIAAEAGDAAVAREQLEAAAGGFEEVGASAHVLETLEVLVETCREQDDGEAVRESLQHARTVRDRAPDPAADEHGAWIQDHDTAFESI